jgi:ATP-dependent helicase/nuclease subunit A
MNLHKVKGLEAPIVFLADATGDVPMRPTLHIDRSGATVKGYLLVQGRTFNNFAPVLASPADWEQIKPIESEFEKSERIRLNYVAATRAGAQVTITQRVTSRKGGNQYNPWKSFYEATGDAPLMPDPGRLDNAGRKPVPIEDTANPEAEARIAERWTAVKKHTYRVAGVKAIVAAEPAAPMLSTEHGTEWGSVIHGLLQAAMVDPQADLTTLSESLAAEHDLGPEAAELAVETVRSVMASEIWQRAMNSTQRLVEVPFQVMASPEGSPPTLLRGVIDLTFREPAGWVIVDYKTDRKALADLPPLVDQYGGQVRVYADSWAAITGEPVCEIGLYFTHTGMYVTLGQA